MGVCPAAAVVVVGRQLVARTRFGGGEGRSCCSLQGRGKRRRRIKIKEDRGEKGREKGRISKK